jgi:hypothetical protein
VAPRGIGSSLMDPRAGADERAMIACRRAHRALAAVLVAGVFLAVALPAPAQANPLLLGSAAASVLSTIVTLGSYLFVANTHDSEHQAAPGLPAMIECSQEADGSTICWPASQQDPGLPAAPAPPAEDMAVPSPPARVETP